MSNENPEIQDKPHVDDKTEHIAEEFNEPPVAGKAVDRIDEHTPSNPAPTHNEIDPSDGRGKDKAVWEALASLANNVNTLTSAVAGMVKDEKVNKRIPWTHRGRRE